MAKVGNEAKLILRLAESRAEELIKELIRDEANYFHGLDSNQFELLTTIYERALRRGINQYQCLQWNIIKNELEG